MNAMSACFVTIDLKAKLPPAGEAGGSFMGGVEFGEPRASR